MAELVRFFNARVIADFEAGTASLGEDGDEANGELFSYRGQLIERVEFERLAQDAEAHHVDLRGGWVIPGLRDAHCHPLFAGREAAGLHLDGCVTTADVLARLTEYRTANPALSWIDGDKLWFHTEKEVYTWSGKEGLMLQKYEK